MNGLNWLDQTEPPLAQAIDRQDPTERPGVDLPGDSDSRQHHSNPDHAAGDGLDAGEYEINPDAVANEGFFDAITSLFKSKPKEVELSADNDVMEETLRKSILNDTWLKEQTFTHGSVSIKGPAILKGGKASQAVTKVVQDLEKAATQNAQIAVKWIKPLEKAIAICQKGNFTDYTADQLRELRPEMENLDYPQKLAEPPALGEAVALNLPALDQAGAKEVAQLLLKLYEERTVYPNKSMAAVRIRFPNTNGGKIFEIKDPEVKAAAREFVDGVESALDYYQENFFQDHFLYYDNTLELGKALIQWVGKSVSGVKLTAANEAFMNVSNEGIVEGIRQFFGIHNRGANYIAFEGGKSDQIDSLTGQLDSTYGNPAWLAKQTPVKGQVKASDISKAVDLTNIDQALTHAASSNTQIDNAKTEAIRKFYQSIKPGLDLLAKAGRLTDKAYESLKQLTAAAKPASELYRGPAKPQSVVGQETATIEALSIDKMPELSKQLSKLLTESNHQWMDGTEAVISVSKALEFDFFLQYLWNEPDDIKYKDGESKYNKEAWNALGKSIARKASYTAIPVVQTASAQFRGACQAAALYMERSLAGGKVSTENFTVANEGIVATLLAFFKSKGDEAVTPPSLGSLEKFNIMLANKDLSYPGGKVGTQTARHLAVNGKLPTDLVKAILDDVKQYMQVYTKAKQTISKFDAHYRKHESKLESFCGDADRPEEFEKVVKAWLSTQPKAFIDEFKAPTHTFMGFNQDAWITRKAFETYPATEAVTGEVTFPAMDASQVNKLKAALAVLLTQYNTIQDYYFDDVPSALDFTDAPFRGYSGIDKIDLLLNGCEMGNGVFEERTTDVLNALCNRMFGIFTAVVQVLSATALTTTTK